MSEPLERKLRATFSKRYGIEFTSPAARDEFWRLWTENADRAAVAAREDATVLARQLLAAQERVAALEGALREAKSLFGPPFTVVEPYFCGGAQNGQPPPHNACNCTPRTALSATETPEVEG